MCRVGSEMDMRDSCSAGAPADRSLIIGDSGSDSFADHMAVEPLAIPLNIRDVSGKILSVFGTRRVRVLLDGVADCVIPFVVPDVTRLTVLSLLHICRCPLRG